MVIRRAAALLAALTVMGVIPHPSAGAQTRSDRAEWTVMMYVTADTSNIEGELLVDVEHAAEVGSSEDMNILALVDRAPDQYDGPMLNAPDWNSTKLFSVGQGQVTELADFGEVDMASEQTLAWFVYEMMNRYPAERYSLSIHNHGGGIDGASWDDSTGPDANGVDAKLTLEEITRAIAAGTDAADEDKIDLLVYAVCLLATYDAASQLSPYVDYLVASEDVSLGSQWDMSAMLAVLRDDPDDIAGAGQTLVDLTASQYGETPWLTMSMTDLRKMPLVDQALTSFARAVGSSLDESAVALGRAQNATLHFGVQGADRDDYQLYDIGDLMARLQDVPDRVTIAANALYNAALGAVVSNTAGPAASSATGMSIYFPATVQDLNPEYATIAASRTWAALLDEYFKVAADAAQDVAGGELAFASPDLELEVGGNGVLASGTLTAGNEDIAVSAMGLWGTELADGSIGYLLAAPAVINSGSLGVVAGGWDYGFIQLVDSEATLLATTLLEPVGGGVLASIPIIYQTSFGQQTEAMVQVLIDGGAVSAPQIVQTGVNGASATIVPAAGDVIAPLLYVQSAGGAAGYQLASEVAVDATELDIDLTSLPSGSPVVVTMVVGDAAGNKAVASGQTVVP